MIHMSPKVVGIGTTVVLVLIFAAVVITPRETFDEAGRPSEIHRPLTALEQEGRATYISYGCQYCHTQYIRQGDWGLGAERIAQAGDYVDQLAPQLGSNRNGPDLSQQGGEHSDDWHAAHFYNPRWTRPESFMPPFPYWSEAETRAVIAYLQSLGGKLADDRSARQWHWRRQAMAAYEAGVDENVAWVHGHVPRGWLEVPNPYPITAASFERGEVIYQRHCLGCHGPVGDGQGPASAFLYPPAFNFTTLRRHGLAGGATGGMLYYQIMNGITGTAMPYFKRELESEKIWDVSNYVARQFIGIEDANQEPRGIDAAFEPLLQPLAAPGAGPASRAASLPDDPAAHAAIEQALRGVRTEAGGKEAAAVRPATGAVADDDVELPPLAELEDDSPDASEVSGGVPKAQAPVEEGAVDGDSGSVSAGAASGTGPAVEAAPPAAATEPVMPAMPAAEPGRPSTAAPPAKAAPRSAPATTEEES